MELRGEGAMLAITTMRLSFGALMGLAACSGTASTEAVTSPEVVRPAAGSPAAAAPSSSAVASPPPVATWIVKMLVAPPPRSSDPRCNGGATVNCEVPSVEGVIARFAAGFSRCVTRAAAAAPTATPFTAAAPGSRGGPHHLQMRAGPNGEVLAVTPVQMGDLSPAAVDCIVERAGLAQFPPPDPPRAETWIDVRFLVERARPPG